MQKVLRHMTGVIEKTCEFLWFSDMFEIMNSWCIEKTLKFVAYFNKSAPCHRWSYWNLLFCLGFLTFLKSWIHKNLRNHWNSIGNTRNAAHWHRWNYSKNPCLIVVFFHFWNHEFMMICKNVAFSIKFQQFCSFMSMELFKIPINSCRFF